MFNTFYQIVSGKYRVRENFNDSLLLQTTIRNNLLVQSMKFLPKTFLKISRNKEHFGFPVSCQFMLLNPKMSLAE